MLDLARALTDNWDYRKALPLWTKLREYVPDKREFIEGEVLCRLHTGDLDLARDLSTRLLEEFPGNTPALLISANLAQRSENPEDALPYLRQMMKQESNPVKKEGIRVRILRLLVSLHKSEPARFGLGEAIKLARERIDYDRKSVDARLMLAELLLMSGRYEESEVIFGFVLARINPHNLRARKGMFEVQMALHNYEKAHEQLVGIAEFNPHDPYLYYYISRWKATKGDYYGAHEALDKLERAGQRGAVPVFLYHGLTTSDYFMDALSVDLFQEQVQALKEAGFNFLKSSEIPDFFRRRNFYESGILLDDRKMNIPPERVVVINFDDGRRDSMKFGTRVAEEEGVTFSMHIPTGYVDMRHPFICTWEQLEKYSDTGVWDFGSHFKDAAILAPIDEDGRLGHALANRIWREDLGRMENMREYEKRLETESSESRLLIEEHLGGDVNFASYPFGDIGQEINSNVRKPMRTILEHVRPHYDVGFIQSPFGFAVNGAYRLSDYWDMTAALMNFDFSDDNNRVHYSLGSSWLLNEHSGFRAGVGYSYASADKDTQAYWSPYELRRFYVEGGFRGNYLRNYYNIRLRLGSGRESVRPEDEADYELEKARAAALNYEPGEPPEENWETIIGVSASTRIPIRDNWSLNAEISYSKLPNYNSLNINGGIRYEF